LIDDASTITWLETDVPAPFRLLFSNRQGGVSRTPYESLNLGFKSGDEISRVRENRYRLAVHTGIPVASWTLVRQVHSSRVARVEQANVGAGSLDYFSGMDDADAMITRESDAALCILAADCVPVAVYGGHPPAIGLAHSGWKGTWEEIAGETLKKLESTFGVRAGEVAVTLGPGIRSCCYEVDAERADSFRQRFGDECVNGSRLDLFRAIHLTLHRAGVKEGMIRDTGVCTCCDSDYYSFRREGTTGRQAAILQMTGVSGEESGSSIRRDR
jgi:YfiH family protein